MVVLEVYRSLNTQKAPDRGKAGSDTGKQKDVTEPEGGVNQKTGIDETEGTEEDSEIKRVFICSPFHPQGDTEEKREKDLKKNIELARDVCGFAIREKCIPYAPHLYFPQMLKESDPDERELGILFGLDWLSECDELWIVGRRISEGMKREIRQAKEWNIPIKWAVPETTPEERLLAEIFGTDTICVEMN